ncbi:helix-turn-helix domain-containing protein, partial [Flavobacterium psychrophilum]|uniref:helix-turn-helix domain-containing protein n=2 Tax=Flavobacterium psychrophilum TaxID=96345 RepID=UPI001E5AC22F
TFCFICEVMRLVRLPAKSYSSCVVLKSIIMSIGEQIKKVRLAKGLSQKEVVMGANIDKAQFSRIENSKTDPSFSTIEKIAKSMGCTIAELFASAEELKDINSHDKSLMEKLVLMETLNEEEKQTLFNILDAFVSKKKYKDTLSGLLQDVK